MAIACRNGYGAVDVVNLDARISVTNLERSEDDVRNNATVLEQTANRTVWIAWGATSLAFQQSALAPTARLYCIGHTANGSPRHPARKSHDVSLMRCTHGMAPLSSRRSRHDR